MAAIIKVTVQSLRRLNELGDSLSHLSLSLPEAVSRLVADANDTDTISTVNIMITQNSTDPRAETLFLLSSPLPVIGIVAIYLYFVRVWGPRWMANKEPFKLDRLIQVYNILQVLICSYLCYKGYVLFWSGSVRSRWICLPVDYSNTPIGMERLFITWLYFMVKIFDLTDTIFFVLRKKNRHISFLHVYHHAGMVICGFIAAKYYPGGHETFLGLINSFVHAVMYSYYLVSSLSSKYKQNLWWKKHITQLQMVQFFVVGVHNLLCVLTKDCPYPKWPCAMLIPQNFIIMLLFADFYRKTYFKKNT